MVLGASSNASVNCQSCHHNVNTTKKGVLLTKDPTVIRMWLNQEIKIKIKKGKNSPPQNINKQQLKHRNEGTSKIASVVPEKSLKVGANLHLIQLPWMTHRH